MPKGKLFLDEVISEWESIKLYLPFEKDSDTMQQVGRGMLHYIFIIKNRYFVKRTFGQKLIQFLANRNNISKLHLERLVGQVAKSLELSFYTSLLNDKISNITQKPSFRRFKTFLERGDLFHLGLKSSNELNDYVQILLQQSSRKFSNTLKKLADIDFSVRILVLFLDDHTLATVLETLSSKTKTQYEAWINLNLQLSKRKEVDLNRENLKEAIWQSIFISILVDDNKPSELLMSIAKNLERIADYEESELSKINQEIRKLRKEEKSKYFDPLLKEIEGHITTSLEKQKRLKLKVETMSQINKKVIEPLKELQGINVDNAGLVLLWPYWKLLFERLDLMTDDEFISKENNIELHIYYNTL